MKNKEISRAIKITLAVCTGIAAIGIAGLTIEAYALGNPTDPPKSSIVAPNGTEFDFYDRNDFGWEQNTKALQAVVNALCTEPITDKKIPVYFQNTNNINLFGKSAWVGTLFERIEIYDQNIFDEMNLVKKIKPEAFLEYCPDGSQQYISFYNIGCRNGIRTNNPKDFVNAVFVHELTHVCKVDQEEVQPRMNEWVYMAGLFGNSGSLFSENSH